MANLTKQVCCKFPARTAAYRDYDFNSGLSGLSDLAVMPIEDANVSLCASGSAN
jgi:hypothetical protein